MKKNNNLKKIALLGLTGGILLAATGCEQQRSGGGTTQSSVSQKQMSAAELYAVLTPEERQEYDSLDSKGKKLALELANQSCKGQNSCKGLNSCKSSENSCKGQGGCKGKSQGPFADKNDAVKVAAKHMAEKRQNLNS